MQEDKTKVYSYRNNGPGFMDSLNLISQTMVVIVLQDDKVHTIVMLQWLTLWRLHVLKHIVERSTHMCYLCHPRKASARLFSLHHVILLPFYPQIKDVWLHVSVARRMCRLSLGHPSSTYITLLYIKTLYNTSAMIYKLYFRISPIYLHLALSNTSWHG